MIIDGKAIAAEIQSEIAKAVKNLTGRKPSLAVIIVGDHAPSEIYVSRKTKACAQVGMNSIRKKFSASISQEELIHAIEALNHDPTIDGILVQLPLPPHISSQQITSIIHPDKDVDGFHPVNVGKLLIGDETGFQPCTPLGIKELLVRSNINTEGKHVVVVGRSNIVGKPMAALLMQSTWGNATVTVAHRKSEDLKAFTRIADILVSAIGQPKFITADMVKDGAVVIDVGINRIDHTAAENGYTIVGDVDFENVQSKCSFITPVPGGVGPMTIAMLLSNTLKSYHKRFALGK